MLIDESQLINWSTAIWDTMMDCQVWYAELSVNHLVTRRPSCSVFLYISMTDFKIVIHRFRHDQNLVKLNACHGKAHLSHIHTQRML